MTPHAYAAPVAAAGGPVPATPGAAATGDGVAAAPAPAPLAVPGATAQLDLHGALVPENPACKCGCNPQRLDKKPPKANCVHITQKVSSTECDACAPGSGSGKHHSHHLGCTKSKFYNMSHGRIFEARVAKTDDARMSVFNTSRKPGAAPTNKDAKGSRLLTSFFGARAKGPAPAPAPSRADLSRPVADRGGDDGAGSGNAPGLKDRLISACAAVGAIFVPPTPQKKKKRDASTAIGDGSTGADPDGGVPASRPMPSLADELQEIEEDERRPSKLLQAVEDQIAYEVKRFPHVRVGKEKYVPYKQGSVSSLPVDYRARFPPGQFGVSNPLQIDTDPNTRPSLTKHSLRGVELVFVRPDLNRAGDAEVFNAMTCCTEGCGCRLKFSMWSWSFADGKFKVLFRGGKRPAIAVAGRYVGSVCGATYSATDVALRLKMSPRVRGDYPVSLTQAVRNVNWHVHEELEALIECDSVTYEGCEALLRREEQTLQVLYNKHLNEYLDHVRVYRNAHPDDATAFRPFPPFDIWLGRPVPGAKALRKRMEDSHYAVGSGGVDLSRHAERVRYMQSVTTTPENDGGVGDECVSSDHTFDAGKSFNLPGPPQIWDVATGFLKIVACVLVATTGATEFLHAAECLAHRDEFKPKVHFTDTWPSEVDLWTALLPYTQGRLDIFHFMKRITDTLRPSHAAFHAACGALTRCIYQFCQDDIARVKRAMRDGSLNGKQHTPAEIDAMRESGLFMKRYRKYIATVTYSPLVIEEKIFGIDHDDDRCWAAVWPHKVDPETGDELGTRSTDYALENQRKHCVDICDVDRHVVTLKPKPKQTHNLCQRKTTRGGKVEAVHSVLGDFANGHMRPLTAQALIEEGIVRFTMNRDAELRYQRDERASPDVAHYRPWLRREANMLAAAAGMPLPYPDEPDVKDDNGERFLYDYYVEQRERKKKYEYVNGMTHCPCGLCSARRQDCPCESCGACRRAPGAFANMPLGRFLDENSVEAYDKLHAASGASYAASMRSGDHAERRGRQLEQLALLVRGGLVEQVLDLAPRAGIDIGAIVDFVPAPAAAAEDEMRTELTVRPPGDGGDFFTALADAAVDRDPAPAPSPAIAPSPSPTRSKKKLSAIRKMSDCPPCSCGKVAEVDAENRRRASQKRGSLRGTATWCAAECEQMKWIVSEGYRTRRD